MKVTSVTAHYERKLNTGDYSSVTLSTWATVELEPGDEDDGVLAYAMGLCREEVKSAARPFIKAGAVPVTVEEAFQGKPVKSHAYDPGKDPNAHDAVIAASGSFEYWKE